MRRLAPIAALALAGTAAAAAAARAHHVVSEYGIAPVEPATVAEVDVQAAAFDFGARSGSWHLVAPAVEVALGPRLSLRGRVPLAHIDYDDGRSASGLGDAELTAKLALHATAHGELLLSAGLGVELPSGDEDSGLGSGHVELAPFVTMSRTLPRPARRPVVLTILVVDRAAVTGGHMHALDAGHGPVLSPHAENELVARLLVSTVLGRAFVSAGVDGAFVVAGEGRGPWVARGEVGLVASDRWRVAAGVEVPFAGDRRFDLRGRVGVTWRP